MVRDDFLTTYLKEPNLLVPGKKPVGSVVADNTHPSLRGCVAWYPLLQIGGLIVDVCGSHSCELDGAEWRRTTKGPALYFAGASGDEVDTGWNSALTEITVAALVKLDGTGGSYRGKIVSAWDGSDGWILEYNETDGWRWWVDTSSVTAVNTTASVNTDWHWIVGTYSSGAHKIYIDGVEKDSDTKTGSLTQSSTNITIGNVEPGNTNSSNLFNGHIANIICFDRALSAEEITREYRDPYAPLRSAYPPLSFAAAAAPPAGASPTGHFYGPFFGSFGGPL